MATSKTLTATNVTMSIPEMSDAPNAAVFSTDVGALGDAANKNTSTGAALGSSLAIVSNNNTHAAIASGQYVYIKNHGTLSEGLYTANAALGSNATLSSSNVTAVSGGGLNALNSNIATLESAVYTPSTSEKTFDFNDSTLTTGMCRCSSSCSNMPSNTTGVLYNYRVSDTVGFQRYVTNGGAIFTRMNWAGWKAWERLATNSDIASMVKTTNAFYCNGNSTESFTPTSETNLLIGIYGTRGCIYTLHSLNSIASVHPISEFTGITVSTSGNTVTITNSTSYTWRFRVVTI